MICISFFREATDCLSIHISFIDCEYLHRLRGKRSWRRAMGAPLGPVEVAARQRMSTQASSSHPGHRRMISMVHGGGNSRILVSRGKSRPIWRDFPSRPELAVIARGKWRVAPQILQAASATANVSPPQHNREKASLFISNPCISTAWMQITYEVPHVIVPRVCLPNVPPDHQACV